MSNYSQMCFLRNRSIYKSRKEAIHNLKSNINKVEDGGLILARYKAGRDIKTILGVAYSIGNDKQLTLFEGTQNITSKATDKKYQCSNLNQ